MRIRSKNAYYFQDFLGFLVAIFLLSWSLKGQKYDSSFMYSLWFCAIISYSYLINILGNVLHGGLFLYNMSLLQNFFEILKGILIFLVIIDTLKRVCHILKKDKICKLLRTTIKLAYLVFIVQLSIYTYYFEAKYVTQSQVFLYYKPHGKFYENKDVLEVADFVNAMYYALGFAISLEIYYTIKSQNLLFTLASLIFLGLNVLKLSIDENYLYYWIQFLELLGTYLLLWAQSTLSKKEQLILMIYD